MTDKRRWFSRRTMAGCMFFLLLLAVCGCIGAMREPAHTVSVDVTRCSYSPDVQETSAQEAAIRLAADREKEIALLREVIEGNAGNEAARESAAAQLVEVTKRMDMEAQSTACLEHMGYGSAAAVCGAQMLTVFVPCEKAPDEQDAVRIADALSSLTGLEAADIKIILTKK